MKKVFIWLQQRILRHRKKLAYGVLTLFIGQICFFGLWWIWIENEVFAAGDETQTQSQSIESVVTEKFQMLSYIQKIIYSLIYPFLVIAGTLVDNSLVYWEVFGFDVILRKLRNIMRNFANFTLWFIFIYKIFKYLIWDKKTKDLKDFLIRLLIAWIWIQASWFAMATLIDMSTILTYSVWWLPMSILKDWDTKKEWNENLYDPYLLKTIIDIDVKDVDKTRRYFMDTNPSKEHIYISECRTVKPQNAPNYEFLLAPSIIYYKDANQVNPYPTIITGCHHGWQIYYFSSLTWDLETSFDKPLNSGNYLTEQTKYEMALNTTVENIKNISGDNIKVLIKNGHLLEVWDAHQTGGIWWAFWTGQYTKNQPRWLDVDNKKTGSFWSWSQKLHELWAEGSYIWVFRQLYSSLMSAWDTIIVKEGESEFVKLLWVALALWHLIAIWIPLIVAGVVFMIRIWILWIAIIISPFIVILTAFNDIWEKVYKNVKFLEYFKIEDLLWIIFSPVIVCLAISLSTVFVTIISRLWTLPQWTGLTSILWWAIKLNIQWISADVWRFVIAILWVAITWFLVRAAVESSKIWKMGIVTSLKKLATSSLWSIPIVPVPWKDGKWVDFVWASTAFGLDGKQSIMSRITDNMKSTYDNKENAALDARLDPGGTRKKAEDNARSERLKTYIDAISKLQPTQLVPGWESNVKIQQPSDVLGNSPENTMFTQIKSEADAQKVIDEINKLTKQNNITNITPRVTADGKTRTYDTTDNIYK